MTSLSSPRITIVCALFVGVLCLLATASCGESPEPTGPPRVVVSIPPLQGLIAPIMPEDAEIEVLVPAGRTVHGFEPSPADMATLARADLVVLVGLGLEGSLADAVRHASNGSTVVTMADVLGVDGTDQSHVHHHDHGHDHHDHGLADPHLWLDPGLAIQFVKRLPSVLPESMRASARPVDGLVSEIEALDEAHRERLAPFEGRSIVTHHASMNRLAERYGLRVAAVLRAVETIEPSAADIAAARRAIEAEGVGAIFVEPQFSGTSAERLAEAAGVKMVVLDPLGDADWFAMMRTNLDRLIEGLSGGGVKP